MRDPYEILGVERSADAAKIKKAFHSLALKYHPDRNPNNPEAEEKFKEISAAYDILGDTTKKQKYDTHGFDEPGYINWDPGINIADLLNLNFNMGARSARGKDIRNKISLSFLEAAKGCEPTIKIEYFGACKDCFGKGAADKDLEKCARCNGTGKTSATRGAMRFTSTCFACSGKGNTILVACKTCNGNGSARINEKLKVTIPPGIDDGSVIRLRGKGEVGEKLNGDLYLIVAVDDHPIFKRDNLNINTTVDIDYIDALLGTTIETETIQGKVKVNVPKHTHPNSILKISKKGIKLDSGITGDHMVKLNVSFPKNISKEELGYLKKIKEKRKL